MTHKYDILFSGEYVTPFSSPRAKKVSRNFGFSIRNEFQDESEFQEEPYLTIAKERIIKQLERKSYDFIVIYSIEAVLYSRRKKRHHCPINKLAKRFLSI